jgi:2-dehydropantoate 2-reductase
VKVAVIGAGAIGGVIADAAVASGHDVIVCVRTEIERLTIERDGKTHEVAAALATETSGPPADVVFVTVKATDTASTAPHLAALCGPGTLTVVVQNGIDQGERVRPLLPVGAGPATGANAYVAAERLGPGQIRHNSGDLLLMDAAHADRALEAIAGGMRVRGTDDMRTEAWRKMLANLVANPITAITLRRMDVLQSPGMQQVARAVLTEAVAVGRADGAALDDDIVDTILSGTARYGAETGSSMLYDRQDGRPMEHRYLTGEVVRRATIHGIAVPVHATLLALLDAVDAHR